MKLNELGWDEMKWKKSKEKVREKSPKLNYVKVD